MGSAIEWTEETWNPVVGCTRVSRGCDHCYAVKHTRRLAGKLPVYQGLVNPGKKHFNGTVRTLPERLEQPLRWRKPRRVFVNSMSDLFHPDVSFEFIDRVWAVMALARDHTFQILTKRPGRMAEYSNDRRERFQLRGFGPGVHPVQREIEFWIDRRPTYEDAGLWRWPLPNVWLGTSVEDQAAADERIPHLLRTPAAVRFLSCEPLLGHVDLWRALPSDLPYDGITVDWVIVGGESGPQSRPCDVEWIRGIVRDCQATGVPTFVKQLGANVHDRNDAGFGGDPDDSWDETNVRVEWLPMSDQYQGAPVRVHLHDRKGGDPEEWPEDLRTREFPETREAVT